MHVGGGPATGIGRDAGQQAVCVGGKVVADPVDRGGGREARQRSVQPGLAPAVVSPSCDDDGVGDRDLTDDDLGDGALVVGGGGESAIGEVVVAGGVVEPGGGVDAGEDRLDPDVSGGGSVELPDHARDHDLLDGEAHHLGLESAIEQQCDTADGVAAAQSSQQWQQVLPEGAAHAAVGELEDGRVDAAVGVGDRAPDHPFTEVTEVVVHEDRAIREEGVRDACGVVPARDEDDGCPGHCRSFR